MAAKALPTERVYVLKVSLLGIKPAVWRRFTVPGEITLDRLHDVIQIAMGWEDHHLHLFKIDGRNYAEMPEEEFEGQEECAHRLCDLVKAAPAKFEYKYDFGDGWHHRVNVEQISKVPEGYKAITKCLEGKRRCPPEDVGGTPGYADFLRAIKNPRHPDHKRFLRWVGGPFNPNFFDLNDVNMELLKYARWSRPRATELELEGDIE